MAMWKKCSEEDSFRVAQRNARFTLGLSHLGSLCGSEGG